MKDRSKVILFDTEEAYATRLLEYIEKSKCYIWQFILYTRQELLLKEATDISLLIVSERSFSTDLLRLRPKRILILNESGRMRLSNYKNISKYQAADELLKQILEEFSQIASEDSGFLKYGTRSCFIGIYSPIKRCMQTNFALTMGQILAKKHRVLYLNFEHYAGDGELTHCSHNRDLADLMYFLDASANEFELRLQIIREKKGNLDYIPPVKRPDDLLHVSAQEWLRFLERLERTEEYDYIIMDLSDCLQGLYEILRLCRRVFTITKEDRFAKGKLLQYEQVLAAEEYEDVIQKTSKCSLPVISGLPEGIENYTRGDLANYVERQLHSNNMVEDEVVGGNGLSGDEGYLQAKNTGANGLWT